MTNQSWGRLLALSSCCGLEWSIMNCLLTRSGVLSVQTGLLADPVLTRSGATWVQQQSHKVILIPFNAVWTLAKIAFSQDFINASVIYRFCMWVERIYSLTVFYFFYFYDYWAAVCIWTQTQMDSPQFSYSLFTLWV